VVDGIVQEVADDALFAGDEVAVFGGATRVPGDELAVAGADEVGLDEVHDVGAAAVHPELEAVAEDGCLEELGGHVAGVAGGEFEEDVVAGEGDFLAVDVGGEDGVELGLAGGVVDFELVLLPLEAFAVGELAFDGDGFGEGAGGAAPAGRVFEDLGDFVEGPDAGALVADEVGDAGGVVVVDVGDEDHVDVVDAVGVAQLIEVVDDEAHGVAVFAFLGDGHVGPEGVAVVDEAGFAALGEQDVEVGAGVGSAPKKVAGDLDEFGVGQDVEAVVPVAAEEAHAAAEAGEGHEAVFETGAVADRVLDGVAVGGEGQVGGVAAQGLE